MAASLIVAVVAGFGAVTNQWLRAEGLRKQEASQRQRADELRVEAERRLVEAEANFELARRAIDSFHTSVSQSRLRDIPGLSTLRLELLGSARVFYEEFLRNIANSLGHRFGLSAAQLRFGAIGAELDCPLTAEPAFRQALASYEALARERPDDPAIQASTHKASHVLCSDSRSVASAAGYRTLANTSVLDLDKNIYLFKYEQ